MYIVELREKIDLPEWAVLSESEFGELTFPCFEQAKKEKKDPKLLAEETVKSVKSSAGYIKKVEALNGYVNLYLDVSKITAGIPSRADDKLKNAFSGKRVRLEHTSVNPNKALHIGHMRNIFLGEFTRRALIKSGAEVLTTYFVEDTGAQVADVLVGFKYLGKPSETHEKFDTYCSKIYQDITARYENEPALKEKRAEVLKSIEKQDPDIIRLLDSVVKKVLTGQMETLLPQNIKYDVMDMESYILSSGVINAAMEKLVGSGVARISDKEENKGCVVVDMEGGERILKRSDGTFLYVAKDIAYSFIKHGVIKEGVKYVTFGKNLDGSEILISDRNGTEKNFGKFTDSITIVGSEQNAEQDVVGKVLKKFEPGSNYRHYSYEQVALSKVTAASLNIETDGRFLRMSGRRGATVEMDSLIGVLKKKLVSEAGRGGRVLTEEDAFKLSSNIVRYSLLKVSPNKMVIFDLEDATALKGDTALYLNYSYARGMSILNKAPSKKAPGKLALEDSELDLVRHMLFWEEKAKESIEELKPNTLCEYAHFICDKFNGFYESNRVMGSDREAERVWIVENFVETLRRILELLGLFVLDRV